MTESDSSGELPVVARITPDLAEACCEDWWQRRAREVDQDRFTKKLTLHSEASRLLADERAKGAKLREAVLLARGWANGDKWRDDPRHRADWKWYVEQLDSLIKESQE